MEYDVFISYSRKDTNIANRVCKAFDEAGITYFIDRQGIGGAYEFPAVLAEAIISSKIFLFLASENSYDSKYTQSEITFAFNRKSRGSILPYIIDGSTMPISLEFVFSAINWRNMREHPIETALVDDLLHLLGKNRPTTERKSDSVIEKDLSLLSSPHKRSKALYVKFLLAISLFLLLGVAMFLLIRQNRKVSENINKKDVSFVDTLCVDVVDSVLSNIPSTEQDLVSDNKKELSITANGVTFLMEYVEAGDFMMGATNEQQNAYADEKPVHKVVINNGYYIGETEVSQALWEAVMEKNPSMFKGAQLPVEQISYRDCLNFITRLNEITGRMFRLPTEAEWEFAARGGMNSNTLYSGHNVLGKVAWSAANSNGHTHEVKTKVPNALGIYDMTGNVWEWCSDCYGAYGSRSVTDPKGPSSGNYRVYRGGCWGCDASFSRLTIRGYDTPNYRSSEVGLRLVLDVD